ncbi:MAG: DUF5683 domain-containing protein [Flavobacteriales bacterium]|nr:DUF5683 domain-containing protein [Flavobacteriales bacterium]
MRAILSLFFLILGSGLCVSAQEKILSENELRVKNTTTWAMLLPSSGQIINKKYWKAPIVLGGLGASVYYVIDNSSEMNLFLENWGYETDDDPLTESNLTDNNGNPYTISDLKDGAYFYRRNRDLSYLSFFGVYLLSVIDANVDAHMKFFDANEDISLRMIPPNWGRSREVWQVGLTLKISK